MRLQVMTLGITALIMQILLLREFLSVLYGSELVIGLVLAGWLLFTGIGCLLGRYIPARILSWLQYLTGMLPLVTVLFIRILRNTVIMPGVMISPLATLAYLGLFLMPFCIVSGIMLTLFTSIKSSDLTKTYRWDAIGSVIGGLIFSCVLIYYLNTLQSALLLLILNLAIVLVIGHRQRALMLVSILTMVVVVTVLVTVDLNRLSIQSLYPGQPVVQSIDSRYGQLVVTNTSGQLNYYENSLPFYSSDTPARDEEVVHYAMAQINDPTRVLVIGGSVSGIMSEIRKYHADSVDIVELDPALIRLAPDLSLDSAHIIINDARRYVTQTTLRYDIILIDLPAPTTAQLNRFYTAEFFREIRIILTSGGIVSFHLPSGANYAAPELRLLQSSIYQGLKESFREVIIVPGSDAYFIASDRPLSYEIAESLETKNISAVFVNRNYLTAQLTQDRIQQAQQNVEETVKANRDYTPIAYYYYLRYWLMHGRFDLGALLCIIALLTIVYLFFQRPVSIAVFAAGFAVSSLEICLIVSFTVLYGYVYSMIGILTTLFMAGLVIGSSVSLRPRIKNLRYLLLGIAGICLLSVAFLACAHNLVGDLSSAVAYVIVPFLMLCIGAFLGMIIPLGAQLLRKKHAVAATIFSADYFGAALGAFITATILIPLLGLYLACVVAACSSLLAALVVRH
jgi:spermidine synthase